MLSSRASFPNSSAQQPVAGRKMAEDTTLAALRVPLAPAELQVQPTAVCVTGATGYIAGHIIQRLLAAGHTVQGTCRDPGKTAAVGHLLQLPGAGKRLKLFQANLLDAGAFDKAVAGCSAVFHCASPYLLDVPLHQARAKLIEPAVQGTENVLAAVSRCHSVKRVVLTSSTAAVFTDPHERGRGAVFTAEDWNLTASETRCPYFKSKAAAEQRAWELAAAQARWSLVVINPPAVWGPPLSSRPDGESVSLMCRQVLLYCCVRVARALPP